METIQISLNYDRHSDQSLFDIWKLTKDSNIISTTSNLSSQPQRINYRSWRLISQKVILKQNRETKLNDLNRTNLVAIDHKQPRIHHSSESMNKANNQSQTASLFSHSSGLSTASSRKSIGTEASRELHEETVDDDELHSDISDISEISEDDEEEEEYEEDRKDLNVDAVQDSNTKNPWKHSLMKLKNLPIHLEQTPSELLQQEKQEHAISPTNKQREQPVSPGSKQLDERISPKSTQPKQPKPQTHFQKQQQQQQHKNIFYISNSPSPSNSKNENTKPATSPLGLLQLKPPVQLHTPNSKLHTSNGRIANHPRAQSEQLGVTLAAPDDSSMQRQGSLFSNFGFTETDMTKKNSHERHDHDEDDDGYSSTDISEDEEIAEEEEEEEEEVDTEDENNHKKEDNDSEWLSVSSDSAHLLNHDPPPLNFAKVDPVPIAIEHLDKRQSTPLLQKPRSLLSGLFLNEMASTVANTPLNGEHDKPTLRRSCTTGVITIEKRDKEIRKPSLILAKTKFPSVTDLTSSEGSSPAPPMNKQETIVGISDVNATSDYSSHDRLSELEAAAQHEKLSTSLNKISHSDSHSTFRTYISKSAMNLSKLYSSSKPKHPSFTSSAKQHHDFLHKHNVQNPAPTSSFHHLHLQQLTPVVPSSTTAHDANSPPTPAPPPPPPSVPLPKVTTRDVSLKEKVLDEDLSQSLKDALIIDYKLGKVALPDRVINPSALMIGNMAGGNDDDDFDDYHSKGW